MRDHWSSENRKEREVKIRYLVLVSILFLYSCGGSEGPIASSVSGQAQTKEIYNWRMVTTWPKNLPGMGVAPETIADMVRKMSDGRLDIKVYGAGEIVPALEVFEAVSQGAVQMGHGAAYYWKGKVKIAQFFTAVPFGLTAQEMNGWLFHGGGMELWRELYARYNLVPIAAGNTGVQMAGWFNKEINSLADIQGMKMRIPGLGGEVFQKAGGIAVGNIAGGEIFTSLQTGVIDATEWVGPYNDLAFGLHQVAKYYYYPGWQEPGPTLEAIVNKEAYDSLPEDLQEILRAAILTVNSDLLAEYTARNNAALRELVDNHGVELRKLPDDVIKELARLSKEVTAAIVDEDPLSHRIYDSFTQYRSDVVEYQRISERAYGNARSLLEDDD